MDEIFNENYTEADYLKECAEKEIAAKEIGEKYGLGAWWADEVAWGGMTVEEAIASQKARDEMVRQMAETDATETVSTVEEFLEHLKIAESIR